MLTQPYNRCAHSDIFTVQNNMLLLYLGVEIFHVKLTVPTKSTLPGGQSAEVVPPMIRSRARTGNMHNYYYYLLSIPTVLVPGINLQVITHGTSWLSLLCVYCRTLGPSNCPQEVYCTSCYIQAHTHKIWPNIIVNHNNIHSLLENFLLLWLFCQRC